MRILSGIQPTGVLHIGNYFGMMRPAIALQAEGEAFYFIANYHALTSVRDPKVLRTKVHEMLEVMELQGEEKKMPVNLSGGMKKRVGLARSIIRQPSCILYDEPTSGLDPVVSDSINRLIRRLQKRFGVTSIVVTHDMKNAFHVADRVAYLHEGRIYFHGTPRELEQTGNALIQDFLLGRSDEQLRVES